MTPTSARAVGDELGNVLRANEDRLEVTAERCDEGALAGGAELEARVGEQRAHVLGEAPLVGKCDAQSRSGSSFQHVS